MRTCSAAEISLAKKVTQEKERISFVCNSESTPVWMKDADDVQSLAVGDRKARRFKDQR